jgi:hypothetical protein
MGGLPGLDPAAAAAAAAAAGGIGGDKNAQLALSQYMNTPAFLMSMGMSMMPGTDMSTVGAGGAAAAPGNGALPGQDGSVNVDMSGAGVGVGGHINSFPPMPGVDMAAMAAAFAADPQQQLQLQQQMQQMPKVEGDAGQQPLQQQQPPPDGNGIATMNVPAMDPAAMAAFDPMGAAMMSAAIWSQPQMMMNPAMMQFQQQAAAAAFAGQQQQQQQQQGGTEAKDGGVNGIGQIVDSNALDTTTATAHQGGAGADAQGNGGGGEDENATAAMAAAAAAAQFQMYGGMLLPGMMQGSGMGSMAGDEQQQKQQQQEEEGAGGGGENGLHGADG